MTLFACTVPGTPIPQSRPKVVRATGRVYYGKRATAQRSHLAGKFYFAHMDHGRLVSSEREKIAAPCRVTVGAAGAHGNSDLDNICKLVLDSLVDAGVLVSDKASVVRELVVRVLAGEPRTEVVIEALSDPS